jgi:hypothetical protein
MGSNPSDLKQYINQVLESYRHTPGTMGRVRREDRRLALELSRRGVSLRVVQDAFLLAAARRSLRPPDAAPLTPVRSLHYFLPVIEEVMTTPFAEGYADYLKWKLRKIQADHDTAMVPGETKPG